MVGETFLCLSDPVFRRWGNKSICALNPDGPINKEMVRRGRRALYHNAAGYIVRYKVHECWKQWEEAGFAMVDPKPLLNQKSGVTGITSSLCTR